MSKNCRNIHYTTILVAHFVKTCMDVSLNINLTTASLLYMLHYTATVALGSCSSLQIGVEIRLSVCNNVSFID